MYPDFPSIISIHRGDVPLGQLSLSGWIKTHRQSKKVAFIELTDGSSVQGLQLVVDPTLADYEQCAARLTTGAAISVRG